MQLKEDLVAIWMDIHLPNSAGSLHELLLLSVPDKLLAGRNAGLVKSRDFHQVAAAYTAGSVKKVSGVAGHTDIDIGINKYL